MIRNSTTPSIAVVGGGITGLAAAWECLQRRPDCHVTVYEPGSLGGKLRTSAFAGRLVDEGADAFLARVPEGRQLAEELGCADSLVSPAIRHALVAKNNQLHRLPEGLVLGVPTDPVQLAGSALVSPEAANRVRDEPTMAGLSLRAGEDPSIGQVIRARLGDDILERLVDPLVGGINAGDSDHLSLMAAVPQFAAALGRSTSLVEGLRSSPTPANPNAPIFHAFPGGMSTLVSALVAALTDAGCHFRSDAVIDLGELKVDAVVVATPTTITANLVDGLGASDAAGHLRAIRHASPVLLTLAFHRHDIKHPLDASGFLVPKPEGRLLTACTFASTKWPHLQHVEDDLVLLRASAGRFGDERAISMDERDLEAALLADLDAYLGVTGAPVAQRVSRWTNGFPQYQPGHLARVEAIETDLRQRCPTVMVAGAAYRGIGVPACIRQGRRAAGELLDGLSTNRSKLK